jgi:hypothetical protein
MKESINTASNIDDARKTQKIAKTKNQYSAFEARLLKSKVANNAFWK